VERELLCRCALVSVLGGRALPSRSVGDSAQARRGLSLRERERRFIAAESADLSRLRIAARDARPTTTRTVRLAVARLCATAGASDNSSQQLSLGRAASKIRPAIPGLSHLDENNTSPATKQRARGSERDAARSLAFARVTRRFRVI